MAIEPEFYTLRIETIYEEPAQRHRSVVSRNIKSHSKNGTRQCAVIDSKDWTDNRTVSNYTSVKYKIWVATHVIDDEATSEPAATVSNPSKKIHNRCLHLG